MPVERRTIECEFVVFCYDIVFFSQSSLTNFKHFCGVLFEVLTFGCARHIQTCDKKTLFAKVRGLKSAVKSINSGCETSRHTDAGGACVNRR